MKFAIVVSTQPASFSALAYKGEIAVNIAKVRQLGYDGVELAVRDPELLDLGELKRILKENDMIVPAIGTGQAFGEEGLSFTHPDERIRFRAVERIKSQVELAAGLDAMVIIGLIRGQHISQIGRDQAETWFVDAMRTCAAVNPAVRFAMEPLNRYETELFNTVDESLAILDQVDMPNVGLLLDTFHMNIEEPDITETIRKVKDHIFHFHVADSNRWYPGAGHIDFASILRTLREIGYDGFISGEMLPLPDPDTAAGKTIAFLRELNL